MLNHKNLNKNNKTISIFNFNTPNKINKLKTKDNEEINLIPLNYTQKTISPLATYYSNTILPSKKRNNSSKNNYIIKTFNKSNNEEKSFNNHKGGTISFENLSQKSREKSQEQFSISNINFGLLSSNKKKKNFVIYDSENNNNKNVRITLNKKILSDLYFDESYNFNKENKINHYEILDLDDIPIMKLDNNEKENFLKIDYPRKKNVKIYNNEIKNYISQNTKRNSYQKRNNKESLSNNSNNNIKKTIFREEIKDFETPKNEKKRFINRVFKKINIKPKIKLPNFSWVITQRENKNHSLENKNLTKINLKKNINKKSVISLNNSSIKKKQNIKIIDSKELNKIQRGENSNSLNKKYFQQSDIYYRLTQMNKVQK
jgi:hypothetical protein